MRHSRARSLVVCMACLLLAGLAWPAFADDDDSDSDSDSGNELTWRWSVTPIIDYRYIDEPEDDNAVTGLFDQYEFIPNKSADPSVQIGVGDASFDLWGDRQTPLFQFRLNSPTSNLGISGEEISDPFLNQRALLRGHYDGVDLDLRYRRIRTDALRVFPNTAGGGLLFVDLTGTNNRFDHQRTGFVGEIDAALGELLGANGKALDEMVAPELTLRGGYEAREGRLQRRFLSNPGNDWLGYGQRLDQHVADAGGGILLAPWRLLTLTLDVDYESFREEQNPLLRGDIGAGPPVDGTIGFFPNTDRLTGTVLLKSRLGDRAEIEGGFQASQLEQVANRTPLQGTAGLDDNSVLHTSANLSADVAILDALSANAFFKYEQRNNDIDRNTALFNPTDGTQVDEFVRRWKRIYAGVEAVYRVNAANRLALGGRFETMNRDLEFAQPGFQRILPQNALVSDDSEFYTVYGRGHLRLAPAIQVNGELGYRDAPKTGYVTDLDNYVYGKMRAAYTLPLERPVVLSLFGQGGSGKNHETFVDGVGNNPAGPSQRKGFDRTSWLWGLTANAAPIDKLGLFASFFMSQDAQDYDLVLSNLQRYNQPIVPVFFIDAGRSDYEDTRYAFVLGGHVQLTERTDASLAYSFTRADASFSSGSSTEAALIAQNRRIDSDTHVVDIEAGHWLRDGLRLRVGYRYQHYADDSPIPTSVASVVQPFDLTTSRHLVTVGVTLTSDLLEKK